MARRQYDRHYRVRTTGPVWARGDLLNYILRMLGNIRLTHGGAVDYTPEGIYITVPPYVGVPAVLVKLTGGKDVSGYYECAVYANGIDEPATETEAEVRLLGFDISLTDDQGYYLATPIPGTDKYEVTGQVPVPPATGTYYLRSTDGVLSWIEAGQCEDASGVE